MYEDKEEYLLKGIHIPNFLKKNEFMHQKASEALNRQSEENQLSSKRYDHKDKNIIGSNRTLMNDVLVSENPEQQNGNE